MYKNARAAGVCTHACGHRTRRSRRDVGHQTLPTRRSQSCLFSVKSSMPPTKRARKTATAHASTAGDSAEASLLDLPSGWEKALSLPSLKQVAARASLERGWQAIGKEHRAELVAALASRAAEWRSFVASVLPLDAALQKATPQSKRSSTKPVDVARCAAVDAAIRASVHLVPSGSGVHLGGGLVLTCAHCVDHDDDEEDDDDDDDGKGEPRKRDFAGGSSRPLTRTERVAYEAAVVAWRLTAPAGPDRVGRLKLCVTASGVHRVAACVAVDEANDLALLRLEGAAPPAGLGALALGAEGDDATGTAVLAVGNPCGGGSNMSRAWDACSAVRLEARGHGLGRLLPGGGRDAGPQRGTTEVAPPCDAQVRLGPRANPNPNPTPNPNPGTTGTWSRLAVPSRGRTASLLSGRRRARCKASWRPSSPSPRVSARSGTHAGPTGATAAARSCAPTTGGPTSSRCTTRGTIATARGTVCRCVRCANSSPRRASRAPPP